MAMVVPKIDLESLGVDTPKQHVEPPYSSKYNGGVFTTYRCAVGSSLERAISVAKEVNYDMNSASQSKYNYHYRSPADPVDQQRQRAKAVTDYWMKKDKSVMPRVAFFSGNAPSNRHNSHQNLTEKLYSERCPDGFGRPERL